MNRRRFLGLLSTVIAGALVLPYVPEKLYFVGGWPPTRDRVAEVQLPLPPEFIERYVQTYGDLTAEQRTFYSQQLIKRLLPHLPFERYLRTPNVDNIGTVVQFRRWGELAIPA